MSKLYDGSSSAGHPEAVAADLGVTARAVRYRCTRVVAELARFTEIGDLRPAG